MAILFYNTLKRKLEKFIPIKPGFVGIYTCGPTVYNYPHIGNYRAYIFEDQLVRYLEYKGFTVKQVMNITDVDDKTIRDSQKESKSLREFTDLYTYAFFEDLKTLNIKPAALYPRATEHIKDMVVLINVLLKKGYAYEAQDGSIYYDIKKFPSYGKLSHIAVDDLKAGARVKQDEYDKDNPQDFALWKAWSEEDGPVYWETELGKGRPGWHIECSAMSMKYLGETFDIHTGGVDNMFPHHENEIAQSEGYSGKDFVKYWLHCEHLLVEGKKMSKSLGNFYTLRDLLAKGFDKRAIRYLLLSVHYRSKLNFTFESLHSAKSAVDKLSSFMDLLRNNDFSAPKNDAIQDMILKAQTDFEIQMDNDLNISGALGCIFEFTSDVSKLILKKQLSKEDAILVYEQMMVFDRILGIFEYPEEVIPANVLKLADERLKAREKKDFRQSDLLRDEITKLGYSVLDLKQGQKIKKI